MVQELIYTRRLLEKLGFPQQEPTLAFEDNSTYIAWSEGSVGGSDPAKHIDLRQAPWAHRPWRCGEEVPQVGSNLQRIQCCRPTDQAFGFDSSSDSAQACHGSLTQRVVTVATGRGPEEMCQKYWCESGTAPSRTVGRRQAQAQWHWLFLELVHSRDYREA